MLELTQINLGYALAHSLALANSGQARLRLTWLDLADPNPIKWTQLKMKKYGFGFKNDPFKWTQSNVDLDNHELEEFGSFSHP